MPKEPRGTSEYQAIPDGNSGKHEQGPLLEFRYQRMVQAYNVQLRQKIMHRTGSVNTTTSICCVCYSKNPECPVCKGTYISLDLDALDPINRPNSPVKRGLPPFSPLFWSEDLGEKKPQKTPRNSTPWGELLPATY